MVLYEDLLSCPNLANSFKRTLSNNISNFIWIIIQIGKYLSILYYIYIRLKVINTGKLRLGRSFLDFSHRVYDESNFGF